MHDARQDHRNSFLPAKEIFLYLFSLQLTISALCTGVLKCQKCPNAYNSVDLCAYKESSCREA